MELIGSVPNQVHGTLHWRGNNGHLFKGGSTTLPVGDFSQEFHVYSLIWEENKIQWLLDDKVFYTMQKSDFGTANYPFNAPQFFILNVAVGGNWPGSPDESTVFPQRLFVDYIRVFQ
jgi:beta-glucanase (GH16 family)